MWQLSKRYSLVVLVFVLLAILTPTQVQAARIFSFNNNIAIITKVCRDGVAMMIGNTLSQNGSNAGAGNEITFLILREDNVGGLLGQKKLKMAHHPSAPLQYEPLLPAIYVYDTGVVTSTQALPVGNGIRVNVTRENSNFIEVSDTFVVTNCLLSQETPSHFTYQGQLYDNNTPANGQYDFRFQLFNGQTGGQQIGADYPANATSVANGQFAVTPAFGMTAFTGEQRWLEIAVKPLNADPSAYTILTPRQQLVAVPYALHALSTPQHQHLGEAWTGNWPLVIQGSFHSPDFTSMSPYRETAFTNYGLVVNNVHPKGTGMLVSSSGQSALFAYNLSKPSNDGITRGALVGFSENGEGGVFVTRNGENILVGYQDRAVRFAVDKNGSIGATGNATILGTVAVGGDVATAGYMYATNFVCHNIGCTYLANSATFAEMLPAQGDLEAGDLLVIATDGQLIRSTMPNATGVAGVYAAEPGFVGGYTIPQGLITTTYTTHGKFSLSSEGVDTNTSLSSEEQQRLIAEQVAAANAGKIPLAVTGVVPVKASAENGPIFPGDLLTTSTLPGHAMKATTVDVGGIAIHRPGTIIGKALEGLTEGTGVIRVLITLQ